MLQHDYDEFPESCPACIAEHNDAIAQASRATSDPRQTAPQAPTDYRGSEATDEPQPQANDAKRFASADWINELIEQSQPQLAVDMIERIVRKRDHQADSVRRTLGNAEVDSWSTIIDRIKADEQRQRQQREDRTKRSVTDTKRVVTHYLVTHPRKFGAAAGAVLVGVLIASGLLWKR